jgi:hypothetical protein
MHIHLLMFRPEQDVQLYTECVKLSYRAKSFGPFFSSSTRLLYEEAKNGPQAQEP